MTMHKKSVDVHIGQRLRNRRKSLDLSLADLSYKIGISHQQMHKYEQGLSRIPSSTLFHIGKAVSVSLNYFFYGYFDDNLSNDERAIKEHQSRKLNVLVVDDDLFYHDCMTKTCQDRHLQCLLHFADSADSAMPYLKQPIDNTDRPDVVMISWNLPKKSGLQLLKDMKSRIDYKDIPVIILSNHLNHDQLYTAYRYQAAGYISRTFNEERFNNDFAMAINYWSQTALLPGLY